MTEMPNKLTLIAMAGAMETLHAMRLESPKDRYTPDDAAGLCSIAPMTVLFFGGAAPETMKYVHPNFTTHLSDADIARIADVVRPAPAFNAGEVYTSEPEKALYRSQMFHGMTAAGGAGRLTLSTEGILAEADAVRGEVSGKMPATGPFPLPGRIYTDPMPIWTSSGKTDAGDRLHIDGVGEKKDGE